MTNHFMIISLLLLLIFFTNSISSSSSSFQLEHCSTIDSNENVLFVPIVFQTSPEVDDMTANLIYSIQKSISNTNKGNIAVKPCLELIRLEKLIVTNTNNSSFYHLALERKMRALSKNIISNKAVTVENTNKKKWKLIMDVDAQVFPGWFEEIILKRISNDDNENKNNEAYFQREGSRARGGRRDKINTGVMLLNVAHPMTKAIFLEANRTVERRKGGDQTAIQRMLRWYVDGPKIANSFLVQQQQPNNKNTITKTRKLLLQKYVNSSTVFSMNNNENDMNYKELASLEESFDYDVFEKHLVNAGVIDAQRSTVLIHHAHMSGKFKRENLMATYLFKNSVSRVGKDDDQKQQNTSNDKEANDHPYFLLEHHNRSFAQACEKLEENSKSFTKKFDVEVAKNTCSLFGL